MKKNDLPQGILNPFSVQFLTIWNIWKDYKLEEFGFKYKGVISEQTALMQLSGLSKGDEGIAAEIIKVSMSNGWKGLFALKNNNDGYTSNSKKLGTSAARIEAVRKF